MRIVLAIAAGVVFLAVVVVGARSGRVVIGDFIPGWPWW